MKKLLLVFGLVIILIIGCFGIYQINYVRVAHSTFDNYYAFRGCTKLIDKTPTYADCQTNTGETIRMVLYENKWYLDGDLPCPGSVLSFKYISCLI